MHISDSVLVIAGITAVAMIAAAIGSISSARSSGDRRYRPGRPFPFGPLWLPAEPVGVPTPGADTTPVVGRWPADTDTWPRPEPAATQRTGGAHAQW